MPAAVRRSMMASGRMARGAGWACASSTKARTRDARRQVANDKEVYFEIRMMTLVEGREPPLRNEGYQAGIVGVDERKRRTDVVGTMKRKRHGTPEKNLA